MLAVYMLWARARPPPGMAKREWQKTTLNLSVVGVGGATNIKPIKTAETFCLNYNLTVHIFNA